MALRFTGISAFPGEATARTRPSGQHRGLLGGDERDFRLLGGKRMSLVFRRIEVA